MTGDYKNNFYPPRKEVVRLEQELLSNQHRIKEEEILPLPTLNKNNTLPLPTLNENNALPFPTKTSTPQPPFNVPQKNIPTNDKLPRISHHPPLPQPQETLPDQTPLRIVVNQQNETKKKAIRHLKDLIKTVAAALVFFVIINNFVLGTYEVPSGSMEPTIMTDSRIIVNRLPFSLNEINRGDVIVFKDKEGWLPDGVGTDLLVKRVIGLPGEHVEGTIDGKIAINGVILNESEYLPSETLGTSFSFNVVVPEGRVFVLGDNRNNSADSRSHLNDENSGTVDIDSITEKVFLSINQFDVSTV